MSKVFQMRRAGSRSVKSSLWLIAAWWLPVSCMAWNDPPHYVYRVDSRPPSTIFQHGFVAWGNDYNIVAHINGATCSADGSTSGFVSTAANAEAAEAIAELHLLERDTTYIYRIRADRTFYSGPASIDDLQRDALRPLSIMSLDMARRADEWDAVDRIPAENIESVSVRRRDGLPESQSNLRFLNVDTRANEQPFTEHREDTLRHYGFPVRRTLAGRVGGFLSACFADCSVRSGSITKREANAQSACPTSNFKIYEVGNLVRAVMNIRGPDKVIRGTKDEL